MIRPASRLQWVLLAMLLGVAMRGVAQDANGAAPHDLNGAAPQDASGAAPLEASPQLPPNESVQAAEAQRPAAQPLSPPQRAVADARSVARLSHLAGEVRMQLPGAADPVQAALNMPLLQGTRIISGDKGEAEIEFPDGSVLRMTPNSTATLDQLQADTLATQIGLGEGLFYLELRSSDRSSYTVAVGDTSLLPQQNSSFRVRVGAGAGAAQIEAAVLSGLVSVTRTNAYTADLQAGESLRSDPRNSNRYLLADTVPAEIWDHWNEALAQTALDQQNARTSVRDNYAGDQGYGWSDLDANGNWYNVPGEGQVWQPTSADLNFDPYGSGNWVDGGGSYVWASGYAWGWLPYRCGSWGFYPGFGWGWVPTVGCRNFAGWYGGGYGGDGYGGGGYGYGGGVWNLPVRHPPLGWRGPAYPLDQTTDGLRIHRLATVPVQAAGGKLPEIHDPRRTQPVRISGVVVSPLRPVVPGYTSRGQSAVGSSFGRDFPVQTGTHVPVLGRTATGPVALPGRPAEWHRAEPTGSALTGTVRTGGAVRTGTAGAPAGNVWRGDGPRGQRPGTVPVNTTGSTPVNATGAVPFRANGSAPVNATGAVPLGAIGSVPVHATGTPPINATGQTPLPTRTGAGDGFGRGPGASPGAMRPLAPQPVLNRPAAPAQVLAPRPMSPAPAPAAPRSMPSPSPAPAPRPSAPAPSPSLSAPSAPAPSAARPR